MDADLQHPPKVIIEFIKQWELGYDVVVAKRHDRDTDSPFRRLGTNIFYAALNRISDHRVENGEGDFRLMSRQVVETLNELSESNLFMKGLYGFVGFEKAVVPFDTPVREAGESTFSGFALFKLAVTALVTNSVIPLRFSLWTGLLIVLLSIIYLLSEIVRYTLGSSITAGYTTQIALITLIGGANLIFIGFVGEYVGRVFIETKRRPQFIVKRIYDFDKPNP
jgi:glycosyltransferase involved in cell wall biosynthesis